jgi:hypothetical protein
MPETSGGAIEHKVVLFGNLILLVMEMKYMLGNAWDYHAQVLLELVCEIFSFLVTYSTSDYINQAAMKRNRDIDLDPQPPIYAMLSDLHDFYFLSYDGTKFCCMAQISIPQCPRTGFLKAMTQGMYSCCLRFQSPC